MTGLYKKLPQDKACSLCLQDLDDPCCWEKDPTGYTFKTPCTTFIEMKKRMTIMNKIDGNLKDSLNIKKPVYGSCKRCLLEMNETQCWVPNNNLTAHKPLIWNIEHTRVRGICPTYLEKKDFMRSSLLDDDELF